MAQYSYVYLHSFRTARGTAWRLRRDDGKLVTVSRKRLNKLVDDRRLITLSEYEEDKAEQSGKEAYSGLERGECR